MWVLRGGGSAVRTWAPILVQRLEAQVSHATAPCSLRLQTDMRTPHRPAEGRLRTRHSEHSRAWGTEGPRLSSLQDLCSALSRPLQSVTLFRYSLYMFALLRGARGPVGELRPPANSQHPSPAWGSPLGCESSVPAEPSNEAASDETQNQPPACDPQNPQKREGDRRSCRDVCSSRVTNTMG